MRFYRHLARLQTVLMAAMVIMRKMDRWQLESGTVAGSGAGV